MSVWITGAGGLIGSYLVCTAPVAAKGLTRADLDLLDFPAVRRAHERDKPSLIIHCAGLTKSPECEQNPDLAKKLNVDLTGLLASFGTKLVFFSTDLVFDGRKGNYQENDEVNPLSYYGRTKADAEAIVHASPSNIVIRTSLNGGVSPTGDRGFNEQMKLAWREGKDLKLFVDEFRSPISAAVTANIVWKLALQEQGGIFHVAGGERLSRFEIGRLVASRNRNLDPKIQPGSIKDYHGPPRPADTSLDCRKVESLLCLQMPSFSDWINYTREEF